MTVAMEPWYLLRILWAVLALIFVSAAAWIVWRFRDIMGWKKLLNAELASLTLSADRNSPPVQKGIEIIEDTCGKTLKSLSPDFGDLRELPTYIRSIAACFHPGSDAPEMQISVRSALESLDRSLGQLSLILHRPGFSRLRSVSVYTVMQTRRWYLRVTGWVLYRWLSEHRKALQRFSLLRWVVFFDPLVLLVYLSRQLTQLVFVKYLMIDLYILAGKAALEAYNEAELFEDDREGGTVDEVLGALEELSGMDEPKHDPRIQSVRDDLVGFTSMLTAGPTLKKWQQAVYDAAVIISEKHFPDSEHPLEEAAIGPLLESVRTWAGKIRKGTDYPWLRGLYGLRLETIMRARDLSYTVFPKPVQNIIRTSYKTYGWIRWPLKAYRLVKRFTPWKLSLEVGWMVSKRAGIAYLYGSAFDMACGECDRVYQSSRALRGH